MEIKITPDAAVSIDIEECLNCPFFEMKTKPGFVPIIGKCRQSEFTGDIDDMREYCPFEPHDEIYCLCQECLYYEPYLTYRQGYSDIGLCKKSKAQGDVITLKASCPLLKDKEIVYKPNGSIDRVFTGHLKKSYESSKQPLYRFCENCGAKNEVTDKYCHSCGYKMRDLIKEDIDEEDGRKPESFDELIFREMNTREVIISYVLWILMVIIILFIHMN